MLIVILDLSVLNIPPRRPVKVIFIGSVALQEQFWSNYSIQSSWAISAKLFSVHVQIESLFLVYYFRCYHRTTQDFLKKSCVVY